MKIENKSSTVTLFHAELRLEGCDPSLLNDKKWIGQLLRRGAQAAHMKVLHASTRIHKFKPQGITAYVLLAESHISIHTWPENRRALIDVLTCNSSYVRDAIRLFKKMLDPERMKVSEISPNEKWD